uniref:CCHC-type domain-containing protein n=1 Tax=Tanacetum cinerariifolium TaxID=118510 RepID=A0A6L2LRV3_TANCI|nr:hypothetical protein [Tanacetum cinerariifolium]
MSRDVLTVGSTMRIPLLYRGEYSQWVERFMNYLEEQTDGEAMINSIKNGDQPFPRVTQVSIAGTSSTEEPPLKDKSMYVNDAIGLKKTTVVVTYDPLVLIAEKTEVSKRKEKVVVSLDSEGSDADDFSELKKITALLEKAFNRRKFYSKPTNNNLRTSSISQSANKKQEFVKSDDKKVEKKYDEEKRDMSKVKCYNCKKEGHFSKDCKKVKVKDYEYYKTKMLLAKKDKDEQVLLAEDLAWMESSSDSDQEINANMVFMDQIEKVLSDSETSSSSADDKIYETVHMIMPSKDTLYNGRKAIGFENPSYFEKEKDLRHNLYDEKVIGLGYTLMFLTHSDEALEIEKFKRKKIIIDLEDEAVSLLQKGKEKLKTIESLKSNDVETGVQSSEKVISETENQSENYCQVVEKEFDNVENSKVIAPGMFKLSVSQSVSPIYVTKTSCASNGVESKLKGKRRKRKSSKQHDKQVNKDVLCANKAFVHFLDLNNLSSVRRPKSNGVMWMRKGSSNIVKADLSSVNHSNLNKNIKRYSRKNLMACNNSDTRSAFDCNNARNALCNARMNAFVDVNDLFIFDDVSVRKSHVSKMPFRKKPRDSLNVRSKSNSGKYLPRTVHRWLSKLHPLAEPVAKWIPKIFLWIIDLGCSKHMTGNRALLTNFVEKFLGTVRFGNNDFAVIAGYGDMVIGLMTIKKVYYVEGLGHNLFSIGQFCEKGLEVAFRKSTCFARNEDGVDLLTGDRSSNLYTISLNEVVSNSLACLLGKASSSQSWLWHQRLSHLNFATINNHVKKNLVQGLPKMKFEKDHLCSACEQGKIHQKHHTESSSSSLNDDVQQSLEEVGVSSSNTQPVSNKMVPNVDDASTSHNVFNERLEDAYFDASFVSKQYPDYVYALDKALYGLKQVPRAWYDVLSQFLIDSGFQKGSLDTTLFIKKKGKHIMLIQIYVDDIIFGSTNPKYCTKFSDLMVKRFEMSMMGEMKFFLGLQVNQFSNGIFINQSKYILDTLKRLGMENCDTVPTPMFEQAKLKLDLVGKPVDHTDYRSMIGLMYVTLSRPDIMFATYADHAGCYLDRKNTSGSVQLSGDKLVCWSSKKQNYVSISTAESEYVVVSSCCAKVLWMRTQLTDYGSFYDKVPIYCDLKSAIAISCNPVQHTRIKHIDVRVMSSPNHPTSDIKDAFSSNSSDYTPASLDYVPASPGKTFSESSNGSSGLVPIASPTLSLFHDDPYMKNSSFPRNYYHLKNKMAPKRTSTSAAPAMNQAAIWQLIDDRVAAALEAQAANMENTDLFSRRNCTEDCKVKFATGNLTEDALSWWNSYAKPIGIEQADKIAWSELKRLLSNKYCPRTEVKKMEDEFYNLVMKGNDLKTYARRF